MPKSLPPMILLLARVIQDGADDTSFDLSNWLNARVFMSGVKHNMVNGENVLNVLDDFIKMHNDGAIDIDQYEEVAIIMEHFNIPYKSKELVA